MNDDEALKAAREMRCPCAERDAEHPYRYLCSSHYEYTEDHYASEEADIAVKRAKERRS